MENIDVLIEQKKKELAEPCYNCGCTERSGYLVVGDWLYEDVAHQVTESDEVIEFETCKNCGACQ